MPDVPSPSGMFRVEPERLPAVRQAIDDVLADLSPHLLDLAFVGYVEKPWLGDPVSEDVRVHFNRTVMESPDGAYAAMRKYEEELVRVRDQLAAMEEHYRRTEGEIAEQWGRG